MTTSGIHAIAANARASSNENADANASVNEDISLGKQLGWHYKFVANFITVFYRVQCALFYIENDAELAQYTWKVAEKGFKMAFMINKLAMIKSCEIVLEK